MKYLVYFLHIPNCIRCNIFFFCIHFLGWSFWVLDNIWSFWVLENISQLYYLYNKRQHGDMASYEHFVYSGVIHIGNLVKPYNNMYTISHNYNFYYTHRRGIFLCSKIIKASFVLPQRWAPIFVFWRNNIWPSIQYYTLSQYNVELGVLSPSYICLTWDFHPLLSEAKLRKWKNEKNMSSPWIYCNSIKDQGL